MMQCTVLFINRLGETKYASFAFFCVFALLSMDPFFRIYWFCIRTESNARRFNPKSQTLFVDFLF